VPYPRIGSAAGAAHSTGNYTASCPGVTELRRGGSGAPGNRLPGRQNRAHGRGHELCAANGMRRWSRRGTTAMRSHSAARSEYGRMGTEYPLDKRRATAGRTNMKICRPRQAGRDPAHGSGHPSTVPPARSGTLMINRQYQHQANVVLANAPTQRAPLRG